MTFQWVKSFRYFMKREDSERYKNVGKRVVEKDLLGSSIKKSFREQNC